VRIPREGPVEFQQAKALNEAVRSLAMRHRATAGELLAPLGLHVGQEILLLALAEGPLTHGELARASGCEAPTITASVRRLAAAGLVVRTASPADGRVTMVSLSESGTALLPEVRSVWEELADRTVAQLRAIEPQRLSHLLTELAAGLDRRASDPATGPD